MSSEARHWYCNALQHTATPSSSQAAHQAVCSGVLRQNTGTATHCNTLQQARSLQRKMVCSGVLVHHSGTATRCNTLQHWIVTRNVLSTMIYLYVVTKNMYYNTLQHTVKQCNTLQHTATHSSPNPDPHPPRGCPSLFVCLGFEDPSNH